MDNCIFCAILKGETPCSLVYEDEDCMAFMDLYPVRPGHVLVIPRQHAMFISELNRPLRGHLIEVANQIVIAQKASGLPCDGTNLFINDGPAANQHVPHVHLHVLPREKGDGLKAVFTFASRTLNYFGKAKKRQALDDIATTIAAHMPQKVA